MTIKAIICGKSYPSTIISIKNDVSFCVVIVVIITKVESTCNANGDNTDAYYPALDWSNPFDWQLIKVHNPMPLQTR